MKKILLFNWLLLVPQLSLAAGKAAGSENIWIPILKMFGALAVVVGLLLLFYAASRKGFGFLPRTRDGQIQMIEIRSLGGKKFLCLVQVRGQELLLGVSNERIECLTELPAAKNNFAKTLDQVDKVEKLSLRKVAR